MTDPKTNAARPLQEFDGEARRISYELLKLHRDGAIKEPADASFYANLIHTFGATYTKANSSIEQSSTELTLTC